MNALKKLYEDIDALKAYKKTCGKGEKV